MDNFDTELQVTAETAEAEKVEDKAAAGLGKFSSVEALLAAYQNLEAEFTRRSQRLKELEDGNKAQDMSDKGASSRGNFSKGELVAAALADEEVRRAVIGEYVKTVSSNKGVPLIVGGLSPAAPRVAPKSVKEAGALAEQFLKG